MMRVLAPGLLTTFQDLGRHGWQKFGVPVSGAMDQRSLIFANLLAGNPAHEAALEFTMLGPTVEFSSPAVFALCGGEFQPTLNGKSLEMGRAYIAPKGAVLTIGPARAGCRGYLAVNGGFTLTPVMGSRSTYLKGGFGGWQGRALQKGDELPLRGSVCYLNAMDRRFIPQQPCCSSPTLRVILGPQDDAFSAQGIKTFLSSPYRIDPKSDRMGYRLLGAPIARAPGVTDGNILSDGVAMGSIQVPDALPLMMMADRQTTGGYTKIATVITCDLPLAAQCRPGDTLRFEAVSMEEAQRLFRRQQREFRALAQALDQPDGLWD